MRDIKIEINLQLKQMDELSEDDARLVRKAMDATDHSYAKYSHFCVGAALRLKDGTEMIGANQENASFPLGTCAERSVIFAAQAQYPDQPVMALAIAAKNDAGFVDTPVTPCGACRQVILEIEERYHQPVRIMLYGRKGIICVERGIRDLLPLSFVDENMH